MPFLCCGKCPSLVHADERLADCRTLWPCTVSDSGPAVPAGSRMAKLPRFCWKSCDSDFSSCLAVTCSEVTSGDRPDTDTSTRVSWAHALRQSRTRSQYRYCMTRTSGAVAGWWFWPICTWKVSVRAWGPFTVRCLTECSPWSRRIGRRRGPDARPHSRLPGPPR